MARRTTLRSSKGKKLYAVRNADGSFQDIQTYARAHAADLRLTGKGEKTARKKAAAKRVLAKKKVGKKVGQKKSTKKAVRKTAAKKKAGRR